MIDHIDYILSLRIGYCDSCQNLFCDHPEIRKQSNGECSDWEQAS